MRDRSGEPVVVGDKHHAVAGLAEQCKGARQRCAGFIVLANGGLIQHDPRMRARKWPKPADTLACCKRQLVEMLIDRGDTESAGELRDALIRERFLDAATSERCATARHIFAESCSAPLLIGVLCCERERDVSASPRLVDNVVE